MNDLEHPKSPEAKRNDVEVNGISIKTWQDNGKWFRLHLSDVSGHNVVYKFGLGTDMGEVLKEVFGIAIDSSDARDLESKFVVQHYGGEQAEQSEDYSI